VEGEAALQRGDVERAHQRVRALADGDAPVGDGAARRRGAGIYRRSRVGTRSSTASTSSRGSIFAGARTSEVINLLSLHGGVVASWPTSRVTAKTVVDALVEHWRALGLPTYVQFDNDAIFQGPHHHRD
jgi:hypothetical protein